MPLVKIHFSNINTSAQKGDIAYCLSDDPISIGGFENDGSQDIQYIGPINSIGSDVDGNYVEVDCPNTPSGLDPANTTNPFIMFKKNRAANVGGLKGYYAEVEFINNSTEEAKLFTVSSEVNQSSK